MTDLLPIQAIIMNPNNPAAGIDTSGMTRAQLEQKLKEKEVLLQEMHHRVKNHLASISSLLGLQINTVNHSSAQRALQQCQDRLHVIYSLYEMLSYSDMPTLLDSDAYLKQLANRVIKVHPDGQNIALTLEMDPVAIENNRLTTLGLILNELITNSLNHAFQETEAGEIRINLKAVDDHHAEMVFEDNGIGFSAETLQQSGSSNGLGFRLIKSIVEAQLSGTIDVENNDGSRITVRFKSM